jgi:hypothetical protein
LPAPAASSEGLFSLENSPGNSGQSIPRRPCVFRAAHFGSGTVCVPGGASVLASRLVRSLAPPNCTTTRILNFTWVEPHTPCNWNEKLNNGCISLFWVVRADSEVLPVKTWVRRKPVGGFRPFLRTG